MVTRLKYKAKDPNGLKRGPGFYYLRGGVRSGKFTLPGGMVIKGAYYSKYSKSRDRHKVKGVSGSARHPVGIPKKAASEYAHISDGILTKKILR